MRSHYRSDAYTAPLPHLGQQVSGSGGLTIADVRAEVSSSVAAIIPPPEAETRRREHPRGRPPARSARKALAHTPRLSPAGR
jgi:hypothetical protein